MKSCWADSLLTISLFEGGNAHFDYSWFLLTHICHLLSEVTFIKYFFFAGLSQFKVLVLHLGHLAPDTIHFKLHSVHLIVSVFQFVFHFLHLASLFLESLLILDKLLVNLWSRLSSKDVFQLQKQFFLVSDKILLSFDLLSLCD